MSRRKEWLAEHAYQYVLLLQDDAELDELVKEVEADKAAAEAAKRGGAAAGGGAGTSGA